MKRINSNNQYKEDNKSVQWCSVLIKGLPSKTQDQNVLLSKGMSILSKLINKSEQSTTEINKLNMKGHVVVMYYDINKKGKGKVCITNNLKITVIMNLMKNTHDNDNDDWRVKMKKCDKNNEFITLFVYDWPEITEKNHFIRQVYDIRIRSRRENTISKSPYFI